MKTLANNAANKGKLRFLALIVVLIMSAYANVMAQPFVSINKNGVSTTLSIHPFDSTEVYQEASSASSINQALWSTLPVLVSFCIIMFFLSQFLFQIIRDRKLTKNRIHRT